MFVTIFGVMTIALLIQRFARGTKMHVRECHLEPFGRLRGGGLVERSVLGTNILQA